MLHIIGDLRGYTINATDGEIGKVEDFYFDDQHWAVRYLIVDTGGWLLGRKVLISPTSIGRATRDRQSLAVSLSKKQVEDSPSIDTDKPVSRQYETSFYEYYHYPRYWGGPYLWGPTALPGEIMAPPPSDIELAAVATRQWTESSDPHLRSAQEVTGYYIEATDGEIGHVEDFLVDDESWAIRYMLIDTKNWWPGKKVVVSPDWIERVSWPESRVYVNKSRDNIQHAPEYEANQALTRDFETRLHPHYNRAPYWD